MRMYKTKNIFDLKFKERKSNITRNYDKKQKLKRQYNKLLQKKSQLKQML